MGAPLVVLAAGLARRYGGCKPLAPIGPEGEAVIDLLVSDAVSAGFDEVVLVLHPETGPAVRYHVERCWPHSVQVAFTEQRLPLGTVHAVLAAKSAVGTDRPFAVSNADDVYGEEAMSLLLGELGSSRDHHTIIAYRLRNTVATDDPVTRGICEVDSSGALTALTERRQVARHGEGDILISSDGREPAKLDGDLPTSVNLWAFTPAIWEEMDAAMVASGLDEDALLAQVAAGGEVPKTEVLLPEVVATMVAEGRGQPVQVTVTESKLIGVTHAADLPVVSAELSRQVAWGMRPSSLFAGVA
jgi:hypothetical protein